MYPTVHFLGKTISSYSIMAILGIIAVCIYSAVRCKQTGRNFNDQLYYLVFALLFMFLGASLLYQLTVLPNNLSALKYLFTDFRYFQSQFTIGLVYYGGLFGVLIGCLVYTRFFKQDTRMMFMQTVPAIPLFHFFGRIGCLLVGCCHGVEDLVHGVYHVTDQTYYLPVQLYEAIGNLVIFGILVWNQHKQTKYYQPAGLYFVLYGTMRFILEFFRGDEIRGHLGALSTSQWISLIVIPLGIYCLVVPAQKNFFTRWYSVPERTAS